jgi:predicted PurR-regulated permease PerM
MSSMPNRLSGGPERDADRTPIPVGPTGSATQARVLIVALFAALCIALLPYASGLMGAIVLYVIAAPTYRRIAARIGPRVAGVAMSVAALLLVLLPAAWLTAAALGQVPDALGQVGRSEAFTRLAGLRLGPWEVGAQLAHTGETFFTWISGQAFAVLGGIAQAIINLVIAVLGLYYLLRSRDAGWSYVRPIIPFSDAGADALRARFSSITRATVLGILATALSQGTMVALGFWIVGLPNVLVWGVVTGLFSILPVLGSAIVWGPGVLVLIWSGRYGAAGVLLAIGLVLVSNIDNVVRPMVYRHVSGLHPLVTLVGAFAGVRLLGLTGLLLGPLAISFFFETVRIYRQEYGVIAPQRQ